MATAQMRSTLAIMMMATRGVMCEQTLTEQEDRLFADLQLPDIIMSIEERKPKYVGAPTWREVNAAKAPQRQEFAAQRAKYYSGLIFWTVVITCAAGTGILAANHAVQQRCRAGDARPYVQLPSPAETDSAAQRTRILRKLRVIALFLIHVFLVTLYMLQASRSGELTPKLGLSWERWLCLLVATSAWTIAQALWAVLTCRATARRFSAATFAISWGVYICPVISDGFDTVKDVAFIATLLSLHGTLPHILGWMCLIWLVSLYSFMIGTDDEAEDAVLSTFASVATALNKQAAEQALADEVAEQAPAEEGPEAANTSWFNIAAKVKAAKEKALVIVFFQTTPQKRKVLILEDGLQGLCAVVTIIRTGASIMSFFFIVMMNIALPASKWLFGWAFHSWIGEILQEWLVNEAEVAKNAGLTARFQSLQVKLADLTQLNMDSENKFPPGTQVNDTHARLLAWKLQEKIDLVRSLHLESQSEELEAWVIHEGTCRVSKKGWTAVMASDVSQELDLGLLKKLVLSGLTDFSMYGLVATMVAKECSLTQLFITDTGIGDAGAVALADALKLQECRLTHLAITNGGIGDADAAALAEALKLQDCSLRSLNLTGNNIGDAGAEALASAISKQECGLINLDLGEHGIGEKGAVALAEAIGPQDRFDSLRAKLIDITQLNVSSYDCNNPEFFFGELRPVTDGHAYVVAWRLKDSTVRKFSMNERPCRISRKGWELSGPRLQRYRQCEF